MLAFARPLASVSGQWCRCSRGGCGPWREVCDGMACDSVMWQIRGGIRCIESGCGAWNLNLGKRWGCACAETTWAQLQESSACSWRSTSRVGGDCKLTSGSCLI